MPHNDYQLPPSLWTTTTVVTPDMLRQMDQRSSECIDGDNGGTWAPALPIIIGGSGLQLAGAGLISGGLTTGPRAPAGGAIVMPAGGAIGFVSGTRSRTIELPIRDFYLRRDEQSIYDVAQWYDESAPGSFAVGVNTQATVGRTYIVMPIPAYRLHASGLSSITLRMRVGVRPAVVPSMPASLTGSRLPGFRLLRIPANGAFSTTTSEAYFIPAWTSGTKTLGTLVRPATPNSKQFRVTTAGTTAGAEPAGFGAAVVGGTVTDGSVVWTCEIGPGLTYGHYATMPLPTSPSAYFAQGTVQDIVMSGLSGSFIGPYDTNAYVIDILDQAGTQNTFHSLKFTYAAINSFAPPV
jgi:hypothetical protein